MYTTIKTNSLKIKKMSLAEKLKTTHKDDAFKLYE